MSRIPLLEDPIAQFAQWFKEAEACRDIEQANAMCLSTVDTKGYPDGRMVLLKGFDTRGFVFYTNFESVKGHALEKLPRAALTFHWDPLKRQIRLQGDTEIIPAAEADAYWVTRPRLAQLGAWASLQSQTLESNWALIRRLTDYAKKFGTGKVPRPPHWGGIRVKPFRIEFWRARRGRLHERFEYRRQAKGWTVSRLYP